MDSLQKEQEKDFNSLLDIFDNNLYVTTFAIKKFCMKDVRPSYIYGYLESRNINELNDSIQKLLDMNYSEIKKFISIFSKLSHYDDYEIYKIVYDRENHYEKSIKKEKQIHKEYEYRIKQLENYYKEKIKTYEKYIKKNSLF